MKVYVINDTVCQKTKNFLTVHGRVAGVLPNPVLPQPEQSHADMQFTKIDEQTLLCAPGPDYKKNFFTSGIRLISGKTPLRNAYPENIPYNLLKAGAFYFHNTKYTDPLVKTILAQNGFRLFHVRQGYAGCSSIAIPYAAGKMLVLSSDPGIIAAIGRLRLPELTAEYFTETNRIALDGYDHGLIGGCCGYDRELGLLVYGKINGQLAKLSVQYHFPLVSVYEGPLTDIGGILVMYPDL
ncbi:MAG: DUF6873 family GME fold protein [Clostridia bacterium]